MESALVGEKLAGSDTHHLFFGVQRTRLDRICEELDDSNLQTTREEGLRARDHHGEAV